MNNIYLIGMMGCGKTTIGNLLALLKGIESIDLDEMIEKQEKCTISEIFKKNGEEFFRNLETDILHLVASENNKIVSCGGGIILRAKNIDIMKNTGKIIYLKRKIDNILCDLNTSKRPLLNNGANNFKNIFNLRKAIYESVADMIILNDNVPEDAVNQIVKFNPYFFDKE